MSLTLLARGAFAPKTISPAPPSAPQRAGFGLGPPAPISARAGENGPLEARLGRFFSAGGRKVAWGALLGVRLEMLLASDRVVICYSFHHVKYQFLRL